MRLLFATALVAALLPALTPPHVQGVLTVTVQGYAPYTLPPGAMEAIEFIPSEFHHGYFRLVVDGDETFQEALDTALYMNHRVRARLETQAVQ